jgi:hypothetical protein
MALIVEDGTGKPDAESYVSVTDADTFLSDRGIVTWGAATTSAKEQALRRATDFLTQLYRERWAGCRVLDTQALDWPRYLVPKRDSASNGLADLPSYYPSDAVPTEVKRACAWLAYKALSATDLAPDQGPQKIRTKVGPIETEYAPGTRQGTYYRTVELWIAPLLKGAGASSLQVVRA